MKEEYLELQVRYVLYYVGMDYGCIYIYIYVYIYIYGFVGVISNFWNIKITSYNFNGRIMK